MFYFAVSRLPIISNIEDGKFFRVFIIGTICYIILHAFLYSDYNNSEFVKKYRSYLYYLWGADLALTGILIKVFGESSQDNSDDDDDEYDEEINLQYTQTENIQHTPKMSHDEIKKKLEEIKKYELELNNHESVNQSMPSVFMKKDQSAKKSIELNKPENDAISNEKNMNNNNLKKDSVQKEMINKQEPIEENVVEYSDTEFPLYKS